MRSAAKLHCRHLPASIVPLPFGSGYRRTSTPPGNDNNRLQLCRSLSGAVIGDGGQRDEEKGCASIVPLPFGSGYVPAAAACALGRQLQLCRSLSGAVMSAQLGGALRRQRSFNCAAPFRERLFAGLPDHSTLVIDASIVPLPFGSGYLPAHRIGGAADVGFNCAAPFRERLSVSLTKIFCIAALLQLCRSLSGAVILRYARYMRRLIWASIVPLPFGSGYFCTSDAASARALASIVPLPFGSGYKRRSHLHQTSDVASIVPLPFGSGYVHHQAGDMHHAGASIVPLPFGSGYTVPPHKRG